MSALVAKECNYTMQVLLPSSVALFVTY